MSQHKRIFGIPQNMIIWFLVSLFYAYQYIIRIISGISAQELVEQFNMTAAQFGQFNGIYYIGYTAVAIPLGVLIDRHSIKKIIICTVAMTALGVVPLIFSNNFYIALVGRFLTGMGSMGAAVGLFKVISHYFPAEKFSKMLGIGVTIGLLSPVFGAKPIAMLVTNIGLMEAMTMVVLCGAFLIAALFIVMPSNDVTEKNDESVLNAIKDVLSNKKIILLAIIGGLMVGPLEGFADAWSVTLFEVIHSWTKESASIVPSLIFAGTCFGMTFIGYLTEKTQKYYPITAFSGVVMLVCMAVIVYGDISIIGVAGMYAALFLLGTFSGYQITVLSKVGVIAKGNVGMATSIANMILMSFGSIFHTAIGYIVKDVNGNDAVYSIDAITAGMSPIMIGIALALPLIYLVSRKR